LGGRSEKRTAGEKEVADFDTGEKNLVGEEGKTGPEPTAMLKMVPGIMKEKRAHKKGQGEQRGCILGRRIPFSKKGKEKKGKGSPFQRGEGRPCIMGPQRG